MIASASDLLTGSPCAIMALLFHRVSAFADIVSLSSVPSARSAIPVLKAIATASEQPSFSPFLLPRSSRSHCMSSMPAVQVTSGPAASERTCISASVC